MSLNADQFTVPPHIQCCIALCSEPALSRLQTAIGRVNVCRTHYPQIERTYEICSNPAMQEIRKAYRESSAFKNKTEAHIGRYIPKPERIPGEDDV